MPGMKAQSALAKKLGDRFRKAVEAHKDDEVNYQQGYGELPTIEMRNGVAELDVCEIKEYKQGDRMGESFYQARAIVRYVEDDKGNPLPNVVGLVTKFGPEPICDTKWPSGDVQTLDEHVAVITNELKKMGCKEIGPDDYEVTCEALQEARPLIKFRTYINKNDKLKEVWCGMHDGDVPDSGAATAVKDNTAKAKTPTNGAAPKAGAKTGKQPLEEQKEIPFGDDIDDLVAAANGPAKDKAAVAAKAQLTKRAMAVGKTQKQVDEEAADWQEVGQWVREGEAGGGEPSESSGGSEADEEVDLDALGAAADEEQSTTGEGEACAQLRALCEGTGIDPDTIPSWAEVAEAVKVLGQDAGDGEEASPPKAKDIYFYKPMVLNPKTKKMERAKHGVEHEVVSVNAKDQTVTLKSLETDKMVNDPATKKAKAVPWTELSGSAD